MKKTNKRLALARETVQRLDLTTLGRVHGGELSEPCREQCSGKACSEVACSLMIQRPRDLLVIPVFPIRWRF